MVQDGQHSGSATGAQSVSLLAGGAGPGVGQPELGWQQWVLALVEQLSAEQAHARHWEAQAWRERANGARFEGLCANLTGKVVELQGRVAELELENEGLRNSNQDLLKKPFGLTSDKREPGQGGQPPVAPGPQGGGQQPGGGAQGPGTRKKKRGGQPGSKAPKRTRRKDLAVQEEVHEPESGNCKCKDCGLPFARNGEAVSERVEIEVKAHLRRIRRTRWRASCECAAQRGESQPEVVAPPEPSLFRGTSYGLSVWVTFLVQVYWQRHPARAFEREWGDWGVRLPASTLLGHQEAFLEWFKPLERAIGEHQRWGTGSARGRDELGGPRAGGRGAERALLAVGVSDGGCGAHAGGGLAQCAGGGDAVRGTGVGGPADTGL